MLELHKALLPRRPLPPSAPTLAVHSCRVLFARSRTPQQSITACTLHGHSQLLRVIIGRPPPPPPPVRRRVLLPPLCARSCPLPHPRDRSALLLPAKRAEPGTQTPLPPARQRHTCCSQPTALPEPLQAPLLCGESAFPNLPIKLSQVPWEHPIFRGEVAFSSTPPPSAGQARIPEVDRFVSCYVLRYSSILTNTVITKVGLATLIRSVLLLIPFTFLIKHLPYCRGNLIHHTYFDHKDVAKLSCGNIKINAIYGLIAAVFIGGFDMFCICMSYAMIIHAVVKLSSADARHKAFSNCTSHICAIAVNYIPAFFNFFSHRFGGSTIPHHVHIFIANLYLLLPPTMNPLVYGLKTKKIHEGVIKPFVKQKDI
ncbi:olfactory receptor 52N2-like [Mesocricetus auratus]|uniref:Olfactory receptor 52N2-like n=1 Tax=Mesocricetus auratus TaxID=10036 RepID=A0ABM2WHE5_MESAU|nr:olfactory receptor 52N2-like [Mesocricetus auratus]